MRCSRLSRRIVAAVSAAALVLGQALVAAHACVLPAPDERAVEACHHDQSEPAHDAVCKAHCEAAQQSVDQPRQHPAPDLAAPLVIALDDVRTPPRGGPAARRDLWLAHAGAPPPLLLTGRFRI